MVIALLPRSDSHGVFGGAEDPFPPKFRSRIKVIFKRMFRVYAHIYHSHFRQVVALSAEAHLNSCFKVGLRLASPLHPLLPTS